MNDCLSFTRFIVCRLTKTFMVLPKLVAIFDLVQVILVLDIGKNKKSVHDITIKKAFHES